MKTRFLIIAFLLSGSGFSQPALAQSAHRLDSLRQLYWVATQDTARVALLRHIAFEHYRQRDFGQAETALAEGRRVLARATGTGLDVWRAQARAELLLIQGSVVLERTGNYDSVFGQYQAARAELDKYPETRVSKQMSTLLANTSYAFIKQGWYHRALDYQLQALAIDTVLVPISNRRYLDHLAEVGNIYTMLGNQEQAVIYYLRCLEWAKATNTTRSIYICYGKLGEVFGKSGQYEQAIGHIQAAIDGMKQLGRIQEMANLQDKLAGVYSRQGHFSQAVALYRQAIGNQQRGMATISPVTSGLMNRLAHTFVQMGQYDSARRLLAQVLDIQQKNQYWGGLAVTLPNLGDLHLAQRQYGQAQHYFLATLNSVHNQRNPNALQRAYAGLVAAHKGLADYKNALYYQERAIALGDSLEAAQNADRLAEFQAQLDSRAKETTIQRLETANQAQQNRLREAWLRWWLLLAFGVAGLAGAALVYRYRARYQAKLLELEKKHAIQLERERISRDLHDNIGSQLALVSRQHDQLLSQAPANPAFGALSHTTHHLLTELRQILWALGHEGITTQRLAGKVAQLVHQHQNEAGADLVFEEQVPPGPVQELGPLAGMGCSGLCRRPWAMPCSTARPRW
ncbi:MAG: tetratricopeptide repeat protein [Bernardetiaceae bacterium]|jgi:hypothetical protein|nr:tetratricopeptide repeat protein [Bernardetiaceae bacterium]